MGKLILATVRVHTPTGRCSAVVTVAKAAFSRILSIRVATVVIKPSDYKSAVVMGMQRTCYNIITTPVVFGSLVIGIGARVQTIDDGVLVVNIIILFQVYAKANSHCVVGICQGHCVHQRVPIVDTII